MCTEIGFSSRNAPLFFDAQKISPVERLVTAASVTELNFSSVANASEQQKNGTPLIAFAEPYLCKICKRIVNKRCINCKKVSKKLISGTLIRNLILKKLEVPDIYMRKSLSCLLRPSSIIS